MGSQNISTLLPRKPGEEGVSIVWMQIQHSLDYWKWRPQMLPRDQRWIHVPIDQCTESWGVIYLTLAAPWQKLPPTWVRWGNFAAFVRQFTPLFHYRAVSIPLLRREERKNTKTPRILMGRSDVYGCRILQRSMLYSWPLVHSSEKGVVDDIMDLGGIFYP